ncbi:MAG TPA: type II secretion system F family protein [Burkholderiaceae bacterium]|nr:type II secretion system F family protein [Burkholderiaceae bacterium]
MAKFAYTARGAGGEKIEGVLDADDGRALAEALAGQGLLLVRAQPAAAVEPASAIAWWPFGQRIRLIDLILFCRQMATLLKSGVPLLRSLASLEESATNVHLARVLASLQRQLESGRELSAAMKSHAAVFSDYVVSTIRVGEVTGRLPEAFNGLYSQLSFERENREAVATALRYPAFVLVTAIAALAAANLFVIPAFAGVYRGLHAELPLLTRVLIATSQFFVNAWPVLLVLSVGAAGAAVAWVREPAGRRFWDGLKLRLPVVGALVRKAALARFTKSFGLAIEAGVPVVDALQVAVGTTGNVVMGSRIATMVQAAERGEKLARAAQATGVFTPMVMQMIAVGEETGALGDMMDEVAEHYQREVDYAIKSLGAKLEPILIVVLGAMILVFALGIFLPMWDLSRVAVK